MIHVYGLTDPTGPPLELGGIDDQPVRVVVGAHAAAVATEHEAAPAPDAEVLLRHAYVVEQVMATRPVLPARFGTGALDEAAVLDRLADPSLPDALTRVRGRIEIAVRIVTSTDGPPSDAPAAEDDEPAAYPTAAAAPTAAASPPSNRPGSDHLARLAARRTALQEQREQQDERIAAARSRLEAFADDSVDKAAGSPRVRWHAALLVPAGARDAFGAVVGEVAGELAPELAVLCTGPWPPYSFTPDTPTGRAPQTLTWPRPAERSSA